MIGGTQMKAFEDLLGQLGPDTIQRMAAQLGASPQQTQSAIQAALPLLMGAMQRNASTPQGAQELHRAVTRDHQDVDLGGLLGGLLSGGGGGSGLGGLLGGAGAGGGLGDLMGAVMGAMGGGQQPGAQGSPLDNGAAILGHVFGQQQPRAAAGVARASGLDSATAASLMAMLAPMLMGTLGQATQRQGLDAGGLSDLLGNLTRGFGSGQAGGLQQMLGGVLDRDGDGDVDASDLLAAGSSLFGSLMRR
jgi:hypothetical protein